MTTRDITTGVTGPLTMSNGVAWIPAIRGQDSDSGIYFAGNNIRITVDSVPSINLEAAGISVLSSGGFRWSSSSNNAPVAPDTLLTRKAAATVHHGDADAASPVDQTLGAQGSRSGTDTNVAGANFTIRSGIGTGNATGSSLIFQTPTAGASGTSAQTSTTRLTLTALAATFVPSVVHSLPENLKSYTVATLPAGTQGDHAYVTDATAPTYNGALTGGGAVVVPVFKNASAWVSI